MVQQKSTGLKLAFMGTPEFAVSSLSSLVQAGHELACIYSQPPRPAGRGNKIQLSPVHKFALENGIKIRTPKNLKSAIELKKFKALAVDIAIIAAYGLILPRKILSVPSFGCINIHASLLPRWRGAAPIQRAIQFGDNETGISIIKMTDQLDAGPIFTAQRIKITSKTTTLDLHNILASLGSEMIVEALNEIVLGHLKPKAQPKKGITYANKIVKSEGHINWSASAIHISRLVRALNPWPGAWFELGGERIKLLAVEIEDAVGPIGYTLDDALLIACGEKALRITRLQRSGKKPLSAKEFLLGKSVKKGTTLS